MFFVALVLIGLHVVAAIYHQYVLKDGLIRRMMKAE
jgi:cytochrome b561